MSGIIQPKDLRNDNLDISPIEPLMSGRTKIGGGLKTARDTDQIDKSRSPEKKFTRHQSTVIQQHGLQIEQIIHGDSEDDEQNQFDEQFDLRQYNTQPIAELMAEENSQEFKSPERQSQEKRSNRLSVRSSRSSIQSPTRQIDLTIQKSNTQTNVDQSSLMSKINAKRISLSEKKSEFKSKLKPFGANSKIIPIQHKINPQMHRRSVMGIHGAVHNKLAYKATTKRDRSHSRDKEENTKEEVEKDIIIEEYDERDPFNNALSDEGGTDGLAKQTTESLTFSRSQSNFQSAIISGDAYTNVPPELQGGSGRMKDIELNFFEQILSKSHLPGKDVQIEEYDDDEFDMDLLDDDDEDLLKDF